MENPWKGQKNAPENSAYTTAKPTNERGKKGANIQCHHMTQGQIIHNTCSCTLMHPKKAYEDYRSKPALTETWQDCDHIVGLQKDCVRHQQDYANWNRKGHPQGKEL